MYIYIYIYYIIYTYTYPTSSTVMPTCPISGAVEVTACAPWANVVARRATRVRPVMWCLGWERGKRG